MSKTKKGKSKTLAVFKTTSKTLKGKSFDIGSSIDLQGALVGTAVKTTSDTSTAATEDTEVASGKLGQLGSVSFVVSSDQVRTISELSITKSHKRTEINYINKKPKTIYSGEARGTASFKMELISSLGVDVAASIETLESYAKKGTDVSFIIGGKPIFSRKVFVSSVEESDLIYTGAGDLIKASCSVSVEEV